VKLILITMLLDHKEFFWTPLIIIFLFSGIEYFWDIITDSDKDDIAGRGIDLVLEMAYLNVSPKLKKAGEQPIFENVTSILSNYPDGFANQLFNFNN